MNKAMEIAFFVIAYPIMLVFALFMILGYASFMFIISILNGLHGLVAITKQEFEKVKERYNG